MSDSERLGLSETCRRCGIETRPWWSYGTRRGVYCLAHVPLRYRLLDRWREWRRP